MKALQLAAVCCSLCLVASPCLAQESAPQSIQGQAEPGTGNANLKPASKAPKAKSPSVRSDSKPHTDIDQSVDSSSVPMDLGLGAFTIDLGHDIMPTTPPGMLARSVPGNPRMVYFALPHRSGHAIEPADQTIIAARQSDLVRAARFHGYDLTQSGWLYQQGVCPAAQPDADALVGVPPGGDGQGYILLHFIRHTAADRASVFTAVIPRSQDGSVRVVAAAHNNDIEHHHFLSEKTSGAVVNQALPPSTLYKNLQPVMGWIPASACIAEIGGAYPHIPNEPSLSDEITIAPSPSLRLGINGEREMIFTDRIDQSHYVIWTENVSNHGKLLSAQREQHTIVPYAVTNPPVPKTRYLSNMPLPPSHITPEPPSPLSGDKQ